MTTSVDDRSPMRHEIRPLTGVRGVAAIWVVFNHVYSRDHFPFPLGTLIWRGYQGVDLFFVLSGFVMALSYARAFSKGFRPAAYGVFLVRRMARVYPLYALVTLAVIVLNRIGYFGDRYSIAVSMLNLTMLQSLVMAPVMNLPTWSLSAELAAYLLFPVLAALIVFSNRRVAVVYTVLACLILFWISRIHLPFDIDRDGPLDLYDSTTLLPVLRCLTEFALGLVAFRLAASPAVAKIFALPFLLDGICLVACLCLFAGGSDVLFSLLLVPIIIGLALTDGVTSKILGSAPILWLGRISYAVYLLHWQFFRVRHFVDKHLIDKLGIVKADTLGLLTMYVSLFCASYFAYRFVEIPARRWLRKAGSLFRASGAVSAT